ncbi:restriction endonuclease subunit S, partial [Psychrobacter celer]|uniref:restriction endonuclease subunit S n=1 Tax=Psychrobacter celer TaxID=306572 RepID=UPI003FD1E831
MVPNGWEEKRLGKVAEFQRGFDLPSAKRLDGNIPIISSSGVSGFHNESKVKAPGIVTGRYGTIGNVFLIDEDFWPLNTSLWVKDFHQNEIKFIYYLLQSFDFKKFSDKTGVPGVNRNDLHAVKVKVPPLPEQRKIAKILTTWDKAIDTTERLIDNSKQQKKALMQQLLTGKKRLLDENGERFEGEWKSGYLEELCDFKGGSAFKEKYQGKSEGDLPFIKVSDMNIKGNEKFIIKSNNWIMHEDLSIMKVKSFPAGSVVFAKVGAALLLNRRRILVRDTIIDNNMMAAMPKDICITSYLYYLML